MEISLNYARCVQEGKLVLIPLTATRFLDSMAEGAIAHLLLDQGLIAEKSVIREIAGRPMPGFTRARSGRSIIMSATFCPKSFPGPGSSGWRIPLPWISKKNGCERSLLYLFSVIIF